MHVEHTCVTPEKKHWGGHCCFCGFAWDSKTPFPEGRNGLRHRFRHGPEGLEYLGFGPDNLTADDGRRSWSIVTEDDLDRWEGKSEAPRRRGFIRSMAGNALWRLMRGD